MMDAVVLYHDGDQAKAAFAAALEYGMPITLATAPGAARYAGPAYLAAALDEAETIHPDVRADAWIDCGEDADLVLRSIKAGWRHVVFSGRKAVADRIGDICAERHVELRSHREFGKSASIVFDLGDTPDPMPGMRNFIMTRHGQAGDSTDRKARKQS